MVMKTSESIFSVDKINSEGAWSKQAWPITQYQLEQMSTNLNHPEKSSRNGVINRTIYFTLVLVCMGFCLYHSIAYLREYFQYPTVLNIQVNTQNKLDFPAVTVCNYNRIRSEALHSSCCSSEFLSKGPNLCEVLNVTCSQNGNRTKPKNIKNLIGSPSLSASSLFASCPQNKNDSKIFDDGNFMKSFSNAYMSLPLSEKIKLGHKPDKFIRHCQFMGQPCNHLDFTTFHNFLYGNCFTFNSYRKNKGNVHQAITDGSMSGLSLELNLEKDEYIFDLTSNIGARLIVHPSYIKPHPENEGVAVTSGLETLVSIEQVNIYRSKPPYPDRCYDYPYDSEGYLYTRKSCLRDCFQQISQNRCNCADPTWPLPPNGTACNLRDVKKVCCLDDTRKFLTNNENICICPLSCFEIQYKLSVSGSKWNPFKSKANKRMYPNITVSDVVKIRVYFQTLDHIVLTSYPKYQMQDVFSNLGGQMGMWLGISLVTLLHYCETFVDSMFCRRRQTIHQSPIEVNY